MFPSTKRKDVYFSVGGKFIRGYSDATCPCLELLFREGVAGDGRKTPKVFRYLRMHSQVGMCVVRERRHGAINVTPSRVENSKLQRIHMRRDGVLFTFYYAISRQIAKLLVQESSNRI